MAIQRKRRRDSNANLALSLPVEAEIGVDLTLDELVVGDGVTLGGIPTPNFASVLRQRYVYLPAVSQNSPDDGDAMTVTVDRRFANFLTAGNLPEGFAIEFKAPGANTGAATLRVDWTSGNSGDKTIKKYKDGAVADLEADNIVQGQIYRAVYDGTYFQLGGGLGGAGGGLVPLERKNSTVDIGSLAFSTGIDGTYRSYVLKGFMLPATDQTQLWIRTDSDGGASVDSGASDYRYRQTVGSGTADISTADTKIEIGAGTGTDAISSDAEHGIVFSIEFFPRSGSHQNFKWTAGWNTAGGSTFNFSAGAGSRADTTIIDAVVLLFNSGDVSAYDVTLYGVANS